MRGTELIGATWNSPDPTPPITNDRMALMVGNDRIVTDKLGRSAGIGEKKDEEEGNGGMEEWEKKGRKKNRYSNGNGHVITARRGDSEKA